MPAPPSDPSAADSPHADSGASGDRLPFAVHVGGHDALWADVGRNRRPAHLVVTPVDLHQRNVERRLREADRPKSALQFARIATVAERVAVAADRPNVPTAALDRVDRLELVREVLARADDDRYDDLAAVLGEPLKNHVETLERTRSELELVTGFDDRRMASFADALEGPDHPVTVDTLDLLDGVARLQADLRDRLSGQEGGAETAEIAETAGEAASNEATQAVSETSLLARATATLDADPALWEAAYPGVDQLSVAGTSMLTAPLEEFCRTVAEVTDTEVDLYLRPASGPEIASTLNVDRIDGLDDVDGIGDSSGSSGSSGPLDSTTVPPTVELVARTREEEARAAVATVAGLVDRGVSPSDVVVTAVDVDPYEDALRREARRYGVTLAVWTPLRLKRTVSYRFLAATLDALRKCSEGGRIDGETLREPLRLGWVPVAGGADPLSPAAVDALGRGSPADSDGSEDSGVPVRSNAEHTLAEWRRIVAESDLDARSKRVWMAYCNWLDAQPSRPTPTEVSEAFDPLLSAYDDAVLPDRPSGEPVSETAETLRGFDRSAELLEMTTRRYDKWLDYGRIDPGWGAVAELLDAFASTVPGRRELPTAAAVDVLAANDCWALDVPYVIAVGLVDSEWPRTPTSAVPSAARMATARAGGSDPTAVRPHSTWTTARDGDHFASAVGAASSLLVATRYAEDGDGVERRPSRFLAGLDADSVDAAARDALVADPADLPDPIADRVKEGDE